MKNQNSGLLRLIAIFKLFKAATLIAAGVAAMKLTHDNREGALEHWVRMFGLRPGGRFLDLALGKLASIPPHKLRDLGAGSFVYAALFLTEGIGLWLMKRWAEWFTVVITGSLIPLEIYEIYSHPTIAKAIVLAINVAVVIYLVMHIRKERAEAR
jgi:uncharacterized membrane protein (DUF2068 family)